MYQKKLYGVHLMKIKHVLLFCAVTLIFSSGSLYSESKLSPVGLWKSIDDKTGDALSHIQIYEKKGKIHGKIVKLLKKPPDQKCDKCKGDRKDKPVVGMEMLWGLPKHKKKPNKWGEGKILDPGNGKTYRASIEILDGGKKLKVRGYIWFFGSEAAGRTQFWYRIK